MLNKNPLLAIMQSFRVRPAWLVVFALALFPGCASEPAAAPAKEASVRPGINQPYFENPAADHWIGRFEIESREIWSGRRMILDFIAAKPGRAVADVGAGTGFLTRGLAGAVGNTGKVYAVDIVPSFLTHIEQKAKEDGITNIQTVLCREDDVLLPEASVDLVLICDAYHHFEYPKSTMSSVHRALRPGGEVVLIDFIREEGKSRKWILEHVRAGEAVVRGEVEAIGFEKVGEARFLQENYVLRFRKR